MLLLSVIFRLQNCVPVLVFSQDIWGNIQYVLRNSDKSFLSLKQNNL